MKHLCENCPLYPCIWTTARSPLTPHSMGIFSCKPQGLRRRGWIQTYSWITWNIQKIILGYIWVGNECILEIPGCHQTAVNSSHLRSHCQSTLITEEESPILRWAQNNGVHYMHWNITGKCACWFIAHERFSFHLVWPS